MAHGDHILGELAWQKHLYNQEKLTRNLQQKYESSSDTSFIPKTKCVNFGECSICLNGIYKTLDGSESLAGRSSTFATHKANSEVQPKGSKISVTPCGHIFHFVCINVLQSQSERASKLAKCPNCNSVLYEKVRPMVADLKVEKGASQGAKTSGYQRNNGSTSISCGVRKPSWRKMTGFRGSRI